MTNLAYNSFFLLSNERMKLIFKVSLALACLQEFFHHAKTGWFRIKAVDEKGQPYGAD